MAPKTQEEKIDEIYQETLEINRSLQELRQVILGVPHSPTASGLFFEFRQHKETFRQFVVDYEQFKRKVIAVFAFMVGTGLLGGGVFGILKLVQA